VSCLKSKTVQILLASTGIGSLGIHAPLYYLVSNIEQCCGAVAASFFFSGPEPDTHQNVHIYEFFTLKSKTDDFWANPGSAFQHVRNPDVELYQC
jgi:hypothetical protein